MKKQRGITALRAALILAGLAAFLAGAYVARVLFWASQ
jgi:hypothetical protein